MSLEKKSVHVRISDEGHARLATLSALRDKDRAELAAHLLEKMLAAEWHDFRLAQDKYMRLGLIGKAGE